MLVHKNQKLYSY